MSDPCFDTIPANSALGSEVRAIVEVSNAYRRAAEGDETPIAADDKAKGCVVFLQGRRKRISDVSESLIGWQYWVAMTGSIPAAAPLALRNSIRNHKIDSWMNPRLFFIGRKRIEYLKRTKYWTPFRQVCLYSAMHMHHQRERSARASYKISTAHFEKYCEWVKYILDRWSGLVGEDGAEVAPYTHIDFDTLTICANREYEYSTKPAAKNLCAWPQTTYKHEECGYDFQNRTLAQHFSFLKVARSFTKSLYSRINGDYFSGYAAPAAAYVNIADAKHVAVINEHKLRVREADQRLPVVDGHVSLDPAKMIVTPFSAHTLSYIMMACKVQTNWYAMYGFAFNKWDETATAAVRGKKFLQSQYLLNFEAMRVGLSIDRSESEPALFGLFNMNRGFEKGETLLAFDGIRIGENLADNTGMDGRHTFGPEEYGLSKEHFRRFAIRASPEGSNEDNEWWIVPALHCPAIYIRKPVRGCDPNVEFKYIRHVHPEMVGKYKVEIVATQTIGVDQEIVGFIGRLGA